MSSDELREKKYQLLRLYHSGKITLSQLKAAYRITAVAAIPEYASKVDLSDALETIAQLDKIERVAQTRNAARQEAMLRLKPNKSKLAMNREEHIAQFATGYEGGIPHNWARYGILVAKGKKKSKPRPGSSKGKVGRTRFHGFKEFNRDFKQFEKSILGIYKQGADRKGLQKQLKRIGSGVTGSVKKSLNQ